MVILVLFTMIEDEKNRSKLEVLYNNYKYTMLYVAKGILKDQDLAEDAVHKAFIKIIDNLEKIDDPICNKTKSFLVIIVRNTAIDMYNHRKKQNVVTFDEAYIVKEDFNSSPLELIISEESIDSMVENIDKLDVKYSDIILLKYFYEYSEKEIAKLLDISYENVRVRLHRGRKMIKEMMEKGVLFNE